MNADQLIRLAEETSKKVGELCRKLRHEKEIARSEKRKQIVDELLTLADEFDTKLVAATRTFEHKILS